MTNHQPVQLTRKQEAHVFKNMMEYLRSLPPETTSIEKVQQLRQRKSQWIAEAVRHQDGR